MNVLVSDLPTGVEVAGEWCEVNTDFRSCLRIMLAFQDGELTESEKFAILMSNLFVDEPTDVQEATERANWFLNAGREDSGAEGPALFSFEHDANLIFAAFRQTHGIDLETAEMHWWKFFALFMDLGSDTAFNNLVALRKRHADGTTTKEEKAAIAKMGEMFYVPQPDTRTAEEKQRDREIEQTDAERSRLRRERAAERASEVVANGRV